jgi:nitroreductase
MLDSVREILEEAVWAPSGDNSQPWRFVLKENTLYIYNVPGKDLPFYNFEQRGSFVAHGALIENIKIVSPGKGFSVSVQEFPEGFQSDLVAIVRFEKVEPVSNALDKFIRLRRTNRRSYNETDLTLDQMDKLKSVASDFPGASILFVEDKDSKKLVAEASAQNEKIVLNTEFLHGPFFEHVVWNEEQEKKQKTGLYIRTLELPPPKAFMFKIVSRWKNLKLLSKLGLVNLIASDNAKQYASCSAFVAIVMKDSKPQDFFETGKVVQRIWLEATRMGLAMHPVSGILFLIQRVFADKTEQLSNEKVQMIKGSYEQIRKAFGSPEGSITFLLRVGTAQEPSASCSRISPEIEVIT